MPVRTTLRLWRYLEMGPGLRRDDTVGGAGFVVTVGAVVFRRLMRFRARYGIVPIPHLGVIPAEAGIHPEMSGFGASAGQGDLAAVARSRDGSRPAPG